MENNNKIDTNNLHFKLTSSTLSSSVKSAADTEAATAASAAAQPSTPACRVPTAATEVALALVTGAPPPTTDQGESVFVAVTPNMSPRFLWWSEHYVSFSSFPTAIIAYGYCA